MLHRDLPNHFSPKMRIAVCYCEYDGHALFLRTHPQKSQGGTWTAPGGKIEKGESPSAAAVREVLEETGIVLEKETLAFSGKFFMQTPQFGDFSVYLFRVILKKKPDVTLNPSEHVEFCWVTPEEALLLPLMYAADQCLEAVYHNKPNIKMFIPTSEPYLSLIETGEKKVEGRVSREAYRTLAKGEVICLHNRRKKVFCEVTNVATYHSFREMLENEGISAMLPHLSEADIEEGLKIYESFPGASDVKKLGAIAIALSPIFS
jgi:8-oxo-dGTP diphosphatase